MGREISIFADYHQQENSLTNYCGLVMKLLYQENPRKFEELLAALVKADSNIIVGPKFTQQIKAKKSVPDLAITQQSFSVFFETKTSDWFYEDQINRHISGFNPNAELKVLFLLSNFEHDNLEKHFERKITDAKQQGIILQPISFEFLIEALEQVCTSEYMKNILDEFKIYLDGNGHLPKWKYLLDVVNCSGTSHEIEQGVYICPDTGGAYSHRRDKYFGPYANKAVNAIFEIKAVVGIDVNLGDGKVKWKNVDVPNESLIQEAKSKIQLWPDRIEDNKFIPSQVFILDCKEETSFIKNTYGGMLQSKTYFWDIAKDCKNSKELAAKLKGKNWEDTSLYI